MKNPKTLRRTRSRPDTVKRVKTGIHNVDRLLGGGIPEKETLLIKGEPGAGKTNLGLEFLYRGALNGENGLYISFQDTEDDVLRANTFDWNFEEHVEQGRINIRKMDPYRYEQVPDMIRGMIKENNADRVVVDPITDLDLYIDSRKDIRKNLLSIKREITNLGATSLLLAENEEATEIEDEVVDGIVNMEVVREQGQVKREIYIKKLRGSDYNHSVHNYVFNSDGLKVQ
ncbi:MAG: circadian clock protein KaiC [Candidatus Nanohaloarchaea archaeon]